MSMTQLPATPQEASLESPPVGAAPAAGAAPAEGLTPQEEQALTEQAVADSRGDSVVPLPALRQSRQETKALKAQVATLTQQLQQVLPVVEQYRQIEPLLPFVAVAAAQAAGQAPGQPAQPPQPAFTPRAQAVAQRLQIKPEDAQLLLDVIREESGEVVQRGLEPLSRSVATQKGQQMMQWALSVKDEHGRPYANPQTVQTVFQSLIQADPKLAESEQVARLALTIARGMPGGVPAQVEPNISELSTGGRIPNGGITRLDQQAAEVRGVSLDRFRQLRNNDSDVLE